MAHVFRNSVHNDPSRSSKVIVFGINCESAYMTSYWTSIVTLVLSCHVSEILQLLYAKSRFFHNPPLFPPKIWAVPLVVDT